MPVAVVVVVIGGVVEHNAARARELTKSNINIGHRAKERKREKSANVEITFG